MKNFFAIMIIAIPMLGYSINGDITTSFSNPDLDEVDPKATGHKDANGLKQGYFIIYGKDMPEKIDYPPDGKIEEGVYKDDKKTGDWIIYHTDGKTPRLKGNFVNGRPNGPYAKYSMEGIKIEQGDFNNGKQTGSFTTYHENGVPAIQKTFNADGKENGPVTHTYENGQVQFAYTAVNGIKTGEATRYWEDGSVKEILFYSADGKLESTTVVNAEAPASSGVSSGSGGPSGSTLSRKDGKKFEADGYNKLYNKADELEMDGMFKGGKLWDGELYKYDSDGILLKIEIWKNGKYHSDGQL